MGLTAKNKGGDFSPAPEGTHIARCCWVIDLGPQDGKFGIKEQVLLGWELPYELIADGDRKGEPYFVSKRYTLSLNEKANLRKDLEAWRGKKMTEAELEGFELSAIAGKPCQVTVTHNVKNDKTYSNLEGVSGMPKGGGPGCPDAVNPIRVFNLDDPDLAVFEALPDWVKETIDKRAKTVAACVSEWASIHADTPAEEMGDDEVPF